MVRRRSLLFVLLIATMGASKQEEVEKIIAAGKGESQVMDHLDMLTNRIGPRLTSSDGLQTACEWARDKFAEFGLKDARLERWGEFPVGFNRGPWSGKVVEPEARTLEFTTPAWSAGTRGVVRGKAMLAPKNAEELEKLKDKLPGAWVLMSNPSQGGPRSEPTFQKTLGEAFNKLGVAGVLRPSRGELVHTDGSGRISWDKLPTVPSVVLLQKQYEELVGWLKADKPVTLEFEIRNYFKKGPIPLYNVVADIPGSQFPDEYVIFGGHIDSWDGASGATDNATGVSTAIEAARILMKSGVKPRRTIRFMLWSGEEQGLLGSVAYIKAHPEVLPKISGVFVHDGGTNYLSGIGGTEAMQSDFQIAFAPVMNLDPKFPFAVKKVPGLSGGGSDHASFLAKDVPGFFWSQSGDAAYSRTHHTQFDTYQMAIPDYQRHSALVIALGAYGIAELDHLLSREKLRAPGGFGNRRMMGVQLDEMVVTDVVPDSAAERAGMKQGDVILKVGGEKVADRVEMARAISAGEPKKKVLVVRDGKEVELELNWAQPAAK